jgi:hypothetical protein
MTRLPQEPAVVTQPMVINYLDSALRVETLSFDEAADFNPQE